MILYYEHMNHISYQSIDVNQYTNHITNTYSIDWIQPNNNNIFIIIILRMCLTFLNNLNIFISCIYCNTTAQKDTRQNHNLSTNFGFCSWDCIFSKWMNIVRLSLYIWSLNCKSHRTIYSIFCWTYHSLYFLQLLFIRHYLHFLYLMS